MTTAILNGFANGNGHSDMASPYLANGGGHSALHSDSTLLSRLRKQYAAAGQSHVFSFYDRLPPSDQAALLAQLDDIDVHRVNRIYQNAVAADRAITPPAEVVSFDDTLAVGGRLIGRSRTPTPQPDGFLPLPEEATATILNNPEGEQAWRDIGLKAVADNSVAVLLMAGGQGTRLGSTSPKGMYSIGLPSGMSLFEYQAGRIKRLEKVAAEKAGKAPGSVRIRWYVMTSGPTREETEKYFASKDFFGLDKDDVIFFEQGEPVQPQVQRCESIANHLRRPSCSLRGWQAALVLSLFRLGRTGR